MKRDYQLSCYSDQTEKMQKMLKRDTQGGQPYVIIKTRWF